MKKTENITTKGKGDKLVITCHQHLGTEFLEEFQAYIMQNEQFLHNAKIVLDVRDLEINANDLFSLRNFLNDHHISLAGVYSTRETTNTSARLLGIPTQSSLNVIDNPSKLGNKSLDKAVIIQRTIRSGNLIEESCDVVVVGDVNPGSVIRSDGSVVIWGKLQGEVHAGRSGNKNARIYALEFNTTGAKIAGVALEAGKKKNKEPEVAVLEENIVRLESWKKIII
ncbi:MAG: septum site-determining protein MinC [Anaerolinea sp.]|nr:septum site-determining protein MinC [Anaerolinea sp.]